MREITTCCELCGKTIGAIRLDEITEQLSKEDKQNNIYRHGICSVCEGDLNAGATMFVDVSGRCIKLSPEATREKIAEEYRGCIVRIPVGALDELVRAYKSAHPDLA